MTEEHVQLNELTDISDEIHHNDKSVKNEDDDKKTKTSKGSERKEAPLTPTGKHVLLSREEYEQMLYLIEHPGLKVILKSAESAVSNVLSKSYRTSKDWFIRQKANISDLLIPSGPNSSNFATVFNMSNSIVGAGILGMPLAISFAGWIIGPLLLIVMGYLQFYTCMLLVETGAHENALSYGGLMHKLGGKRGASITQTFQFLGNLGALVAYVILIGDFLEAIGNIIWPDEGIKRVNWQLGVCLIIVLPLALKRSLNGLRLTSFLSVLFVFVFAFTVLIRSSELLNNHGAGPNAKPALFDINLFRTLPVAVFAFNCHTAVLPIYSEMRNQTYNDFKEVASKAYLLCGILYVGVGLFGYIVFGDTVDGNILKDFDSPFISSVITALFLFTIIFTYPMVSFTARIGLHYMISGKTNTPNIQYWIEILLIFGVSITIGILLKDVGIVFSFIGSISGATLSVIAPAWMVIKCMKAEKSEIRHRKLKALIIFGFFVMISGTVSTILAL